MASRSNWGSIVRDLINKLTLLESGGTLSIPAIANLLSLTKDRKRISFGFNQDVIDLSLELKEGPVTVTSFRIVDVFGFDEDGNLRYHYPSGKSILFFIKIDPIPIDNLRNEMIIGKTAIKIFEQLFGIDDTNYAVVTYNKNENSYLVEIADSREFLALLNNAYQWRQERSGDL
jgi:hypothetical protein